jgi:hypothetical protein
VTPAEEEARHIAEVEAELEREFPAVPSDRIRTQVNRAWSAFATAKVRDFVPLLTQRAARDRLMTEGNESAEPGS